VKGIRAWLKSAAVIERQRYPDWPTPETTNLWREFVKSFENPALHRWDIHKVQLPVAWETSPPPAGIPVRVLHDPNHRETVIYTVGLRRIGVVTPPFLREPTGIVVGHVGSSANRISAEYLGPGDLVSD
jgi:hypothetical protein